MTNDQFRFSEMARILGVNKNWLYYRVATGQTPVKKRVAYDAKDVKKLREWLTAQNVATKTEEE